MQNHSDRSELLKKIEDDLVDIQKAEEKITKLRLSTDEFVEKMRSCRYWAISMNHAVMELQLTVCTPADIFENWFGPDPEDLTEQENKEFQAKVSRAMRIYHDRQLLDIMPDGGYPTTRTTPQIHRVQHKVEFRKR